ncbi:MAG TPA: TonB C-terminal domain-containing protein [Terriglobia bacterium]|nr:TonB C-terminal domain-containing protein [Terriglobia bacterium]
MKQRGGIGITLMAGAALLMTCWAHGTAASEALQAKGSPRLNIYFNKGFNDTAWQKAAFDKVAKSWVIATPPDVGKQAVVIANIARDGKLLDTKLNLESGSADWDKAAVDGVKKAAPYPALPRSWTASSLEAHFHFAFSAQ